MRPAGFLAVETRIALWTGFALALSGAAIVALVGDALMTATAAVRINYAIYGNLDPALHAHLFPRHANEPPATRTAQPWALDWSLAPEYSDALYGDLKRRIAACLSTAIPKP